MESANKWWRLSWMIILGCGGLLDFYSKALLSPKQGEMQTLEFSVDASLNS
jgi:hypothetical protein